MSPERWRQVKGVFRAALERKGEDGAAFLNHACSNDDSLRQEVESLLASFQESGSPIVAAAEHAAALFLDDAAQALVGERLGQYEITAIVGRGGMGVVYRARDTKLNRPVAIKFLSEELTDSAARRRFQREGQMA